MTEKLKNATWADCCEDWVRMHRFNLLLVIFSLFLFFTFTNKDIIFKICFLKIIHQGGYMAAKKAKLEEQFQEAAQNEFAEASSLFNGIAIFVNGYTNPSADELKPLMMAHGGIYHHYLRTHSTTHMIASNLPYSKIIQYRKAQNPKPLCKPEWITDSIRAGKVLDHRDYLLYSQQTKNQPAIFSHLA